MCYFHHFLLVFLHILHIFFLICILGENSFFLLFFFFSPESLLVIVAVRNSVPLFIHKDEFWFLCFYFENVKYFDGLTWLVSFEAGLCFLHCWKQIFSLGETRIQHTGEITYIHATTIFFLCVSFHFLTKQHETCDEANWWKYCQSVSALIPHKHRSYAEHDNPASNVVSKN